MKGPNFEEAGVDYRFLAGPFFMRPDAMPTPAKIARQRRRRASLTW